jgi:hypothetical protein
VKPTCGRQGQRKNSLRLCAFARKKTSFYIGGQAAKAQRKNSLRLGAFARKKINISKKKSLRSLL